MAKQGKYVPLCVRYDLPTSFQPKQAKIQPLVSSIETKPYKTNQSSSKPPRLHHSQSLNLPTKSDAVTQQPFSIPRPKTSTCNSLQSNVTSSSRESLKKTNKMDNKISTIEKQQTKGLRRNRSRSVSSILMTPSFRCIPECNENEDEIHKSSQF
ncbi:unnamed protein product [Auanema sp. JU1783]|nr:unnamed protein product [Auanema sp. JU1783]